jgi:outer membrane protein assembly factor BamE
MRHFLIPVLLLSLVAGCSSVKIGPHRIDVQQGNALDQENVARLKPGLNRSQVRFLLGTPLVVDPFRTDRWDYVYVYYKAGKLAEQKRITLFFEGDTLARIEGDMPAAEAPSQPSVPAVQTEPKAETTALPPSAKVQAAPVAPPAAPTVVQPVSVVVEPKPKAVAVAPAALAAPTVAAATVAPAAPSQAAQPKMVSRPSTQETSVVAPLPSPKNAPAYVDRRPPAELSLQAETNVAQVQPDVIPPFPEPHPGAVSNDDPVLKSVNAWAQAWAQRDDEAYLAAYDASYVPQGGGSRADWEKRRRLLLAVAKNIELKIDSPSVDRSDDGTATVTFNQFYRSESYRDAVVKQLRLAERDGRWLIVEEKVLSILRGVQP